MDSSLHAKLSSQHGTSFHQVPGLAKHLATCRTWTTPVWKPLQKCTEKGGLFAEGCLQVTARRNDVCFFCFFSIRVPWGGDHADRSCHAAHLGLKDTSRSRTTSGASSALARLARSSRQQRCSHAAERSRCRHKAWGHPVFYFDSTWETHFALQVLTNCNGCCKERDNWSNLFCLLFPTRKTTTFLQHIINFRTFNFSSDMSLLLFFSCPFALLGSKTDSAICEKCFPIPWGTRLKTETWEFHWSSPILDWLNIPELKIHFFKDTFLKDMFLRSELFTWKWLILMNNAACFLASWCSSSIWLPVSTQFQSHSQKYVAFKGIFTAWETSSAAHRRFARSPARNAQGLGYPFWYLEITVSN